jgi:hypothetical protein
MVGVDRRKALCCRKGISPWYKDMKLNQIFRAILEAINNVYVGQHYTLLYQCINKTVIHAKQINIFETKQKKVGNHNVQ